MMVAVDSLAVSAGDADLDTPMFSPVVPTPSRAAPRCSRSDRATAPGTYISTLAGAGQARTRYGWSRLAALVSMVVLAVTACSSTPTSTVGDDEFVGHPNDAPGTTDAPPPRPGAMWYRIEPGGTDLRIDLRLLDPPETATFFLPGPWAGHGDFGDLITIEQARGPEADGPLPMAVDREEGRIDIETGGGDWLEISYRVELPEGPDPEARFVPWRDDRGFFAYAPTLLILPSSTVAEQLADIPVELHTPPDWTVSTTWPTVRDERVEDDRRVTGFVADDVRSLRDAFVAAGHDWNRLETRLPDGTLDLTLTDSFAFDDHRLLEVTAETTAAFLGQFGVYDEISAIALPTGAEDEDLGGTGRHGGFVVEIPEDRPLDDQLVILLAHEAMHMWNGHQLVPDPDTADQTKWFKEGLTHYIALKTLSRLELISEDSVRRELARAGQYYRHNPAVAGGRIRAIDRTRLPYDRGLLIGLALDLELHEASNGALSVEDWLAALLAPPFEGEAHRYDPQLLRRSFESLTPEAEDAPIRRYDRLVTREHHIDVTALFGRLGLHYLEAEADEAARLLPIDDATAPYERLFRSPHPQRADHELRN